MKEETVMKSNVSYWKQLQEKNYFEEHPCYKGLVDMGSAECDVIEWFLPLTQAMKVVVIGCGYGRETTHIAKRVAQVYGIDVSEIILNKAGEYVKQNSVTNFTPVLTDEYKVRIPDQIDLVFSNVVMQHLTRDLVNDYLRSLGAKLALDGKMVIQFLESLDANLTDDAPLKAVEPSVSWSLPQIAKAAEDAGLAFEGARSYLAVPTALWHWVKIGRRPEK
jgi:cyclopropane fatty-acyl-phospholipid synthase-like methyltransferase